MELQRERKHNEDILTKPAARAENTNTRPSGGLATIIT